MSAPDLDLAAERVLFEAEFPTLDHEWCEEICSYRMRSTELRWSGWQAARRVQKLLAGSTAQNVKLHVLTGVIDNLCDRAVRFHASGQLRGQLLAALAPLVAGVEIDTPAQPVAVDEAAEDSGLPEQLVDLHEVVDQPSAASMPVYLAHDAFEAAQAIVDQHRAIRLERRLNGPDVIDKDRRSGFDRRARRVDVRP